MRIRLIVGLAAAAQLLAFSALSPSLAESATDPSTHLIMLPGFVDPHTALTVTARCDGEDRQLSVLYGQRVALPSCLEPDGPELELEDDGWFAVEEPRDPSEPHTLMWNLLPAATTRIRVVPPRGIELPPAGELTLAFATGDEAATSSGSAAESFLTPTTPLKARCKVLAPSQGSPSKPEADLTSNSASEQIVLECKAPRGTLHGRLKIPGFASVFLWDRELPGPESGHGPFELQPGASLIGRVELESPGNCRQARCRVALEPVALTTSGEADDSPRRLGRETVAVGEDGFFQITGLGEGQARLRASAEGMAPMHPWTVELRRGLETTLLDPLVLAPPVIARFRLTPPRDPAGKPWQLVLRSRDEPGAPPRSATASPRGDVTVRNLTPGRYRYMVESGADRWAYGEVEVAEGSPPLEIEIPWVFVEGTVTRGGEPVHAQLWFGDRSAPLRHFVDTGDDGTYRGALSRAGLWPLRVELPHRRTRGVAESLSARALDVPWVPPGETTFLDVELPSGTLFGRILGTDDRVQDCDVRLVRAFSEEEQADGGLYGGDGGFLPSEGTVRSGPGGRFQLHHLAAGTARLTARCGTAATSTAEVEIDKGQEVGPVLLELPSGPGLSGRVVGPLGPVAGAHVMRWPQTPGGSARPTTMEYQTKTDLDGRFDFASAGEVRRFALVVQAPGLAARVLDAPASGEITVSLAQDGARLVLEMPKGRSPWIHHLNTVALAQMLVLWPPSGSLREDMDPSFATEDRDTPWQRWTIPNLAAGAYEICFGPGPRSDCRSLLLPPGASSTVVY